MNKIAPKEIADKLLEIISDKEISYDDLRMAFQLIRKAKGLTNPNKGTRHPDMPTQDEMKRFFKAVLSSKKPQHIILLKLLLTTGVRVSELTNIRVSNIDIDGRKIRIEQGKGAKDRYIPIPEAFISEFSQFYWTKTKQTYLFEIKYRGKQKKYTTRAVEKMVKKYAEKSKQEKRFYPHLFRHYCLTNLTNQDMSTEKIQLISGHSNPKSLAVYQHLSLANIKDAFDKASKQLFCFC